MDDLTGASYVSEGDGMTQDQLLEMYTKMVEDAVQELPGPAVDQKALMPLQVILRMKWPRKQEGQSNPLMTQLVTLAFLLT